MVEGLGAGGGIGTGGVIEKSSVSKPIIGRLAKVDCDEGCAGELSG